MPASPAELAITSRGSATITVKVHRLVECSGQLLR
jgi:hypothetical protein